MSTKKIILTMICLIGVFSTMTVAKIYQIPQDRLEEYYELKKIVEVSPNSAEAHFNLAMNYAYTGRILDGWDELKIVHKLDKNFADYVIVTYEKRVSENPTEWKNHFKLAFGYYFKDEKDQAKKQFKEILNTHPKHIWAMGYIALIEGDQKNYDESIRWCEKALKIEKRATAIHYLHAEALAKKGRHFAAMLKRLKVLSYMAEEGVKRPD